MHTRPYAKPIVWQEAHKLCLFICSLTKSFPSDERFRLVDQLHRSSSSVPTNIAEGGMKMSKGQKAHFYQIAATSLEEVHYQCFLAKDLQYISLQQYQQADDHIQRVSYLLTKLRQSL